MSADFMLILSMSADAALAVFAAASVILILWQDFSRGSNKYYAFCMSIFMLYGATSLAWRLAGYLEINPERTLQVVTTAYSVGLILLFNFVLSFAGVPRSVRWYERTFSLPMLVIFLGLVWSGHAFSDFELLSNGTYRHDITLIGQGWSVLATVYLLLMVILINHYDAQQVEDFLLPLLLLGIGLLGFSFFDVLRRFPLNALMVSVAIMLLGRVVVKYQVFQPLEDLNRELKESNAALQEATRQKSQFLANMSHELRTPLNSIIGYTELVSNHTYGDLNDVQEDRLLKVHRNGKLLLALINDVLDLSKIEAGRLEIKPETLNINDVLDALMAQYEPRASKKGLSLVAGYGKLPSVFVDSDTTLKILHNLLDNAIKFTDNGVVILRGFYDDGREQVVLSVADTGPGISPERQDNLFDVYLQAEELMLRSKEGTGLGLAIAYRLAEMNGGKLWFESILEQGTTFYLALPIADESPPVTMVYKPRGRARGPVIVAIDDDSDALELIQDQLGAAKFQVYGVSDANEGLQLVHELVPSLITLDVLMPEMDGWQVLKALRRDPVTEKVPVLVISATDEAARAKKLGANGFLRKPVQAHTLLDEVQRLLSQSRALAETQELEQIR